MASSITRLDYCQFLLSPQITGIEACQCRRARIRRNHIGCAILVWVRLKALPTRPETPSVRSSTACSRST